MGSTFQLPEVEIGDSIAKVKQLIQLKMGIHPDNQQLWVYDYLLEDNYVLQRLDANLELQTLITLQFLALSGESILTIDRVQSTEDIHGLKAIIGAKLNLPAKQLQLVFENEVLHDDNFLHNYSIVDGTSLTLVKLAQ